MNPTEGAFLRLCRAISIEAVEQLAIAKLRRSIVSALLADADRALRAGATVH